MKNLFFIIVFIVSNFLHINSNAAARVCVCNCQRCVELPEEHIPPPNNPAETIKILGCYGGSNCPNTRNSLRMSALDTELLNLKNSVSHVNVATTNSPIQITQADFEGIVQVGKSILFSEGFYDHFVMNIGVADATNAQTWTLPANLGEFVDARTRRLDIISPSSIPPALQIAGATHVLWRIKAQEGGDEVDSYMHLQIDGTEVTDLGSSYDFDVGSDDNFDEEPDVELYDVPLGLGDSQTTEEFPIDESSDKNLNKIHTNATVDAFGTINTPYGSFECLRQTEIIKHYFRADTNVNYSNTPNYEVRRVKWITKNGFIFSAAVQEEDNQHNGLLGFMELTRFVSTNTLTSHAAIKINNNNKGVSINNTDLTPHQSAILDINSDSLGVLIPRIAQANRPSSPAEGLLVYQIDNTPGFYYFDGTAWNRLGSTSSSSMISNARTSNSEIRENSSIRGKNQLENGSVFVKFDQPQDNFEDLIISIQLEGDCNGVYISKKTREGFEVKELKKGKSNVKFSWEIR